MQKTRIVTGLVIGAMALGGGTVLAQQTTTEKVEQTSKKTVAKVESTTNKAVEATKESWITAKTKIALYADSRVSAPSITVETLTPGTVTLRGKVSSADEKKAAEEIARGIDGVTAVRNDLHVVAKVDRKAIDATDSSVKTGVEKRLKQDARLKKSSIDVRVDKGVVTLTGDVDNLMSRARASELARGVPGVRSVQNELKEQA